MTSQHQNCRFYENKYPEVDDVVMVEVCDGRLGICGGHALEADVSVAFAGVVNSGNGRVRTPT